MTSQKSRQWLRELGFYCKQQKIQCKSNTINSKVKLQSLQKSQDFSKIIKVRLKTAENAHKAIDKLEVRHRLMEEEKIGCSKSQV